MTERDREKRIDRIFGRLVTMDTRQALEWLAQSDEPAEVRQRVAELLGADPRTFQLDLDAMMGESPEAIDLSGQEFHGLRFLEKVGSGGTGDVYLAEDLKLQRKVAVKTLRSDWLTSEAVKTRFRREALILSQLDHPGICRIYQLIESDDTDFLVLEYLQGETLETWVGGAVSRRRKLAVARQLLDAISAAHAAKVVHRDLKLRNVMILPGDQVKVLDFGISRLQHDKQLARDAVDNTSEPQTDLPGDGHTLPGSVLGTLDFISPEQARGEEVTTATDIYSLGLIFQALFSDTPAHPRSLGGVEILRRAKAGETEPVKGAPGDLARLIARMKRDAAATRPTALEARDTLDRIITKPRRRLWWVAAAALVVVAIAATWKYTADLKEQTLAAEQARAEAEEVSAFLVDLFDTSSPGRAQGEDVTARELLDQAAGRIDQELAGQPVTRARLQATIGMVYRNLGLLERSHEQLLAALQTAESTSPTDVPMVADTLVKLAGTEMVLGNFEEAEAHLERVLSLAEGDRVVEQALAMEAREHLAVVYRNTSRLEDALAINDALLAEQLKDPQEHALRLITTYNNMALVLWNLDRQEEAERAMSQAIAAFEASGQDDPDQLATLNSNLSNIQSTIGLHEQAAESALRAVRIREEILDPHHPDLGTAYDNLAVAMYRAERTEDAKTWNDKAIDVYLNSVGDRHVSYAYALGNRATLLRDAEQWDACRAALQTVISIFDEASGSPNLQSAFYQRSLGKVERLVGDLPAAAEATAAALTAHEALDSGVTSGGYQSAHQLADIYAEQGLIAEARVVLEALLERLEAQPEPDTEKLEATRESLNALDESPAASNA